MWLQGIGNLSLLGHETIQYLQNSDITLWSSKGSFYLQKGLEMDGRFQAKYVHCSCIAWGELVSIIDVIGY